MENEDNPQLLFKKIYRIQIKLIDLLCAHRTK